MKKYLIEGRYTKGQSQGRTYLLCKGGYVVDIGDALLPCDYYDTERIAKMIATKMTKRNKAKSMYNHYTEPCEYTVKEVEVRG